MSAPPDVVMVGGGIGGLVAALSLHEVGVPVRVVEAAADLKPLGVGINLQPHAVRELEELGLADELATGAVAPDELLYCTKRGQHIWSEPRGRAAGYRWPQLSVHRGRLQQVLHDAVVARLGVGSVLLGHEAAAVAVEDGRAVLTVRRRADGGALALSARVLVGADGIHSAVRRAVHGEEGPPRWNGSVLWRGLAATQPVLGGRTMVWAGHPAQKLVCYPIEDLPDGRQVVNVVAERRVGPDEEVDRSDWTRPGRLGDVLPAFAEWDFGWLDGPALVRAAEPLYVYPMVDRDPLARWSDGPVTLLGDAAHPMYPIGSNGASQAILDARVLAGCLRDHGDDPIEALERYEAERRPATAAVVLANRQLGPEKPMAVVEERAPEGFDRLDDVVSPDELAALSEEYRTLAGGAVDELNGRPSLLARTW